MPISTYTYPPLRNIARAPITPPQVIHPIFPPPSAAAPRSLPIRQNEDPYRIKGFKAYRHSVNAAYPRSLNDSVGEVEPLSNPFGPVSGSSKEERSKNLKTAARECLAARYHGRRRTIEELKGIKGEPALYLGINRFIRYPSSSTVPVNPVTLIVYHANGFHKEQYEPLFSHLSELLPSTEETQQGLGKHTDEHKNGQYVEEIIMVDHYNHGDSYLLNKGLIGKLASWEDTARDLVAMIRHSLPPLESDPEGLPEHLPYHSAVSEGSVGGRKRRIIGVGHSIGGNALVRAARAHPDMFESLILIDPMTRSFDPKYQTIENPMALHMSSSCIGRRDTWPSRQSASSDLLRSPYFQRWDPLVFQKFVETGLIDLSVLSGKREDEGQVTLSTPRWVEASVFCDGTAMVHGYDALPLLPKELKIGFIMAGESSSTGGKVETHEIVHRPPSAENVIITESGHLIAQEQPKALAKEVHRILLGRPIQPDQEVRAKVEAKL